MNIARLSASGCFLLLATGCSSVVSEGSGSQTSNLEGGDTTFTTPDLKSTLHIEHFSGRSLPMPVESDACRQLERANVPPHDAACWDPIVLTLLAGLDGSGNPSPPDDFSNGVFDQWKASKEYRGFVHVPAITYTCNADGQMTGWSDPNAETNDGYTKEPNPFDPYSAGDSYRGHDTFVGTSVDLLDRGDCATVHVAASSRVTEVGRQAQYAVLGYDAPFVVDGVYETICCDGSVKVTVDRTIFPTARLYVDDKVVDVKPQEELGQFIVSGGRDYHASGEGNIAPLGPSLQWSGAATGRK